MCIAFLLHFFLVCPLPNPSFFFFSKKMDDAQTHFRPSLVYILFFCNEFVTEPNYLTNFMKAQNVHNRIQSVSGQLQDVSRHTTRDILGRKKNGQSMKKERSKQYFYTTCNKDPYLLKPQEKGAINYGMHSFWACPPTQGVLTPPLSMRGTLS